MIPNEVKLEADMVRHVWHRPMHFLVIGSDSLVVLEAMFIYAILL